MKEKRGNNGFYIHILHFRWPFFWSIGQDKQTNKQTNRVSHKNILEQSWFHWNFPLKFQSCWHCTRSIGREIWVPRARKTFPFTEQSYFISKNRTGTGKTECLLECSVIIGKMQGPSCGISQLGGWVTLPNRWTLRLFGHSRKILNGTVKETREYILKISEVTRKWVFRVSTSGFLSSFRLS